MENLAGIWMEGLQTIGRRPPSETNVCSIPDFRRHHEVRRILLRRLLFAVDCTSAQRSRLGILRYIRSFAILDSGPC